MKSRNLINNSKVNKTSGCLLPRHKLVARGLSLIDIIIGMLIGAFAIIIILQVLFLSEGQKRTTTSASEAQINGAVALFELKRDIGQSGYGISTLNLMGCNVTGKGYFLPSGVQLPMAPVIINPSTSIIPAGDANTDTLLVFYGNSASSPEGDGVTSSSSNTSYSVQTSTSFINTEAVIAVPLINVSPCSLILDKISSIDIDTSNQVVTVSAGVAGMTNGKLFNLGLSPTIRAYAVRNGNLTVCDYYAKSTDSTTDCSVLANWQTFVSNIVSLRAEYGQDTSVPMDGIVDSYSQLMPAVSSTVGCNYARISAVRMVVVARSNQYERELVTTSAPQWMSTTTAINLSNNTTWQHYRYTTFQAVAPLRNITWLGVSTGC